MRKVGTIQSIWRYPVKGMAGERLQECQVSSEGLLGDRTWAVQDVERQEIQSCKFRPGLLQCRARQRLDEQGGLSGNVDITFADGETLGSDHSAVHQRISSAIGHASELQSLRPLAEHQDFYRRYKADPHTWLEELKATFEREPGEPLPDLDHLPAEMQTYVSLPGTFFLVSPFHIVTTASLERMRETNSSADWRVERFRPNLVIQTLPGMEGLVEQAWIGKKMQIGNLVIDCAATAPRCGAVTRAQGELGDDKSILRSIVRTAQQNLGIYAAIDGTQLLREGEEVWLQE